MNLCENGQVRLLLIGAGKMGDAHASVFSRMADVELVGVVSGKGDSARLLAANHGIPVHGTDWRQVAGITGATACVVAVSHMLSESVTEEVVSAGFHVLAEKPVALHSLSVHRIAEKAKQSGVLAMAAQNRRFFPSVTKAIETIRFAGELKGITVVAPDPVGPHEAHQKYDQAVYDNWFVMNTIHAVDLLRLAGGNVRKVNSVVRNWKGERSICGTIEFESQTIGTFISHGCSPGGTSYWQMILHGDGVEVHLGPIEDGFVKVGHATPMQLQLKKSKHGFKDGLYEQGRAFVEAITESGCIRLPASDLHDHALTLELAEQLLAGQQS